MSPDTKKQSSDALRAESRRGTMDPNAYAAGYSAGVKTVVDMVKAAMEKFVEKGVKP